MDRSYKAAIKVNIYKDQADKDSGKVSSVFSAVPYSYAGFDSFEYRGVMYKGYFDRIDSDNDTCIILTNPLL